MKTVFIHYSGLQELEGRSYENYWGEGEGETLGEVCRDIIAKNPKKGEFFKAHSPNRCSDWGMRLYFFNLPPEEEGF